MGTCSDYCVQVSEVKGGSQSRKVWQGESLTNLTNQPWFAKLKPSILVLTINNLLADLLIRQTSFTKC